MSFMDMPSIFSRSITNTSWVEPGWIATRLPFSSASVSMPLFLPATMAMPLLQADPITTTGWCADAPRMAAAMPNVPKSTVPLTRASLPSVGLSNGMTWMVVPAGANCW